MLQLSLPPVRSFLHSYEAMPTKIEGELDAFLGSVWNLGLFRVHFAAPQDADAQGSNTLHTVPK